MLLSAENDLAQGLLLLSYPLHPPGRQEQKRTAHWPALRVPAFFVHGTRDPFGSPEEMQAASSELGGRSALLFVDRAGHELKPVLQRPVPFIEAWMRFLTGTATAATPSNG
jgi:predicted alpha/beta-hydrolase family hydrolase